MGNSRYLHVHAGSNSRAGFDEDDDDDDDDDDNESDFLSGSEATSTPKQLEGAPPVAFDSPSVFEKSEQKLQIADKHIEIPFEVFQDLVKVCINVIMSPRH